MSTEDRIDPMTIYSPYFFEEMTGAYRQPLIEGLPVAPYAYVRGVAHALSSSGEEKAIHSTISQAYHDMMAAEVASANSQLLKSSKYQLLKSSKYVHWDSILEWFLYDLIWSRCEAAGLMSASFPVGTIGSWGAAYGPMKPKGLFMSGSWYSALGILYSISSECSVRRLSSPQLAAEVHTFLNDAESGAFTTVPACVERDESLPMSYGLADIGYVYDIGLGVGLADKFKVSTSPPPTTAPVAYYLDAVTSEAMVASYSERELLGQNLAAVLRLIDDLRYLYGG